MSVRASILRTLPVVCLLATVFPFAMGLRTQFFAERDSRENLLIALNLLRYGVFSVRETTDGASPQPTTKREPLYPVLLSLWMAVTGTDGRAGDQLREIRAAPAVVRSLKTVNVMLHLGLVLASWWAAQTFFKRQWPVWVVTVLIAFNSSMLSTIDVFLSEIPAALLLVTSSTLLYLAYSKRSFAYPILGGLSLGALALTKAVYFYFLFLLLVVAVVWLVASSVGKQRGTRSDIARWLQPALLAFVALAVYSPWFVRNQRLGETLQMDERGEGVLAIRAEYSTMSWSQYAASFLYFTPAIGPRLTTALFGEQTAQSFDRDNPGSFYRKAQEGTGEVHRTSLARNISTRRAAVRVMVEHLPMMGLLTLPFAYRGAFVQVGFNVRRVPVVLVYFTLAYSVLFVPALIALIVRLARGRGPRWAFLVLAVYSYLFHSLITHYIPRYSLPLIPVFVIALVSVIEAVAEKRPKNETHRTNSVSE